jgi:O-acetylserine/cysteine efflux transporter
MAAPLSIQPRAVAALAIAGVLWGTSDVASKVALGSMSPVTLTALRFLVAMLVLWPLAIRGTTRPSFRDGRVILLGGVGVAGAFLLQNTGLGMTSATNASILQAAAPVLVVAGAALFLRESLDWYRVAGTLLALVGVAAITLRGQGGMSGFGHGELYIVGSAACFAAFILIGRRLFNDYPVSSVLATALTWAFIFVIPFAAADMMSSGIGTWDPGILALVVYLGAGCSALTYFLWGYALRHVEASRAAVFDNIVPVVGVAAAAMLLQEQPSPVALFGGLLVVGGAWLVTREERVGSPQLVREPA